MSPEELSLIASALEFANLKSIDSTNQVENIFKRNVPLIGSFFKVIPAKDRSAYEGDQRELRGWLKGIAEPPTTNREKVGREVAKRLKTVDTKITFHGGRSRMSFALSGVQACYSYAVALILDEQRGLTSKLAQCGWSTCGQFRLDASPKGRPRRYCDSEHKWRAEGELRKRPSHPTAE